MKQTFSIAALLAISNAADPDDFYKIRPMSLIGHQVERPIVSSDHVFEREECKAGADAFDQYCHGRVNRHRYADFRDPMSGECDYAEAADGDIEAQIHCLAQQCMYDYCIWRRDQYIENCDAFDATWATAAADNCLREGQDGECKVLQQVVSFDLRETEQLRTNKVWKARN